jgi:hypothetical protein
VTGFEPTASSLRQGSAGSADTAEAVSSRVESASATAEVGPDRRDGGYDRIGTTASERGDTDKAVRECSELPMVYRDTGCAQRRGVFH